MITQIAQARNMSIGEHRQIEIDVKGSKRLSPTPSVSNLSLRPRRYLSTVTQSLSQGSVDGFRREGCRDLRPLIRSRCKGVLKQNNEWKGELSCVT